MSTRRPHRLSTTPTRPHFPGSFTPLSSPAYAPQAPSPSDPARSYAASLLHSLHISELQDLQSTHTQQTSELQNIIAPSVRQWADEYLFNVRKVRVAKTEDLRNRKGKSGRTLENLEWWHEKLWKAIPGSLIFPVLMFLFGLNAGYNAPK